MICSYLKYRKQGVKVKGIINLLKVILAGAPRHSLLGPLPFNVFTNDTFFFITPKLHNFVDDNTLSMVAESLQSLIDEREYPAKKAIEWLHK